ncbi:hypothetical protein E1292_13825 [Nonomuraea deserti]|uniref:Lipoprotein n=1 Tax=Nonomuraea deserti TaxID=1848322 RepID=A0A4R4W2G0_9ACTN|nr:hypothetical protein [Nonomuraea deserti]TDD07120.1 hypothetical protein E1292_13825 [Nonomuraea deserti]
MRLNDRRLPIVAAALVAVAVVAGCTGNADKPTMDEASKQLITDGDKLLASQDLARIGSATATERADQDGEAGCLKGQVQRFFRAQGNLTGPPYKQSPGNVAGLLGSWLRLRGYDTTIDDLDLRDENVGVAVLQHPTTGITFIITVRNGQKPNILIVGKTSCYAG